MKLFHTYNLSFCSWAVLALIYYAVTTSKIQCPEMRNYFIAWCVSYFLEAIAPFICLISIKKGNFYVFCYVALSIVFLCKIAVIVSLVWKVWRGIGACYIPDDFETFILIANIFELLAIGVLFTLVWRIKLVQKELDLTSK